LKPLELLPRIQPSSETEMPACGRVCEDHMREARLIQDSLLPTASVRDRGIEIAFRFTPFFEVGGDFVDFFRLPDGLIGLYIGDVVGKGLPATMYGVLVMGILRGIHKSDIDTYTVLSLWNQRLRQRPLPCRFCATLYAVFDPSMRTLAFSNAGLPFPLHASATEYRLVGEGGLPSGLLSCATYDQRRVLFHSHVRTLGAMPVQVRNRISGSPLRRPPWPHPFSRLCERVGILTPVRGGHSCPPIVSSKIERFRLALVTQQAAAHSWHSFSGR
jgi:hypothetical protein